MISRPVLKVCVFDSVMFYDKEEDDGEREATEQVFKIIIIGDSGVGKTCLAHRFATGKFPEQTEATIGVDFWERRLNLNGTKIRVSLHIFNVPNKMKRYILWEILRTTPYFSNKTTTNIYTSN